MDKNVGIIRKGTNSDNKINISTLMNGRESPKTTSSSNSADDKYSLDNRNIFSSFDNREGQSNHSFNNFIKELEDSNENRKAPWNKERERIMKNTDNKKRIVLKEINQFDFNDPLKILEESYTKDTYNTNLFANQIKQIENIFSDKEYTAIIDCKEKMEMIKKIIEYYLNYVVEMNFESISNYHLKDNLVRALKKINSIEINLEMSLHKVKESKNKMKDIKKKILLSSAKFLLLKQKLKNMLIIHKIMKDKLLPWKNTLIISKGLKDKNNFCTLWKNIIEIRDDVQLWSKEGTNFLFKKRSLQINEILIKKCKMKLAKLQEHIEKQLNNIFLETNNDILECYRYFMINPEITIDKFIDILFTIFKNTIFKIIKGTFISFTEDQKSSLLQDIKNVRDLTRLKFEENKFLSAFNLVLKNLSKVCECFHNLTSAFKNSQNKDEK